MYKIVTSFLQNYFMLLSQLMSAQMKFPQDMKQREYSPL